MKLELVSHALCPFVHRAAILLAQKEVPHAIRYVDLKAKPDWFLAISPRGKVPLLVADDTVLFESAAIVEFLDETHPPHIVPADPFERARQRAWVEVASELLGIQYRLYTAATPEQVTAQREAHDVALARFETALRGDFFAGDTFGLVDVVTAPALIRALLLDAWTGLGLFEKTPRVLAWAQRVEARPSVRSSVPADFMARFRNYVTSSGGVIGKSLTATSA